MDFGNMQNQMYRNTLALKYQQALQQSGQQASPAAMNMINSWSAQNPSLPQARGNPYSQMSVQQSPYGWSGPQQLQVAQSYNPYQSTGSGNYNMLARDMMGGGYGQSNFTGGRFNYSPMMSSPYGFGGFGGTQQRNPYMMGIPQNYRPQPFTPGYGGGMQSQMQMPPAPSQNVNDAFTHLAQMNQPQQPTPYNRYNMFRGQQQQSYAGRPTLRVGRYGRGG